MKSVKLSKKIKKYAVVARKYDGSGLLVVSFSDSKKEAVKQKNRIQQISRLALGETIYFTIMNLSKKVYQNRLAVDLTK